MGLGGDLFYKKIAHYLVAQLIQTMDSLTAENNKAVIFKNSSDLINYSLYFLVWQDS